MTFYYEEPKESMFIFPFATLICEHHFEQSHVEDVHQYHLYIMYSKENHLPETQSYLLPV